jgi:hypothetical protein
MARWIGRKDRQTGKTVSQTVRFSMDNKEYSPSPAATLAPHNHHHHYQAIYLTVPLSHSSHVARAVARVRAVFNKPAGYSNTSMNTRLTELSPPVIGSKTSLSLPFRYCALITCHALAPCNTNGSPHSACNRRSSPVSRSKTSMSKKTHHLCLSMCQIAF